MKRNPSRFTIIHSESRKVYAVHVMSRRRGGKLYACAEVAEAGKRSLREWVTQWVPIIDPHEDWRREFADLAVLIVREGTQDRMANLRSGKT